MLEDQPLADLAALPSPFPPAPADEVFTASQWRTLLAICEVFLPSLINGENGPALQAEIEKVVPTDTDPDAAKRFLRENAIDDEQFRESVRQRFARWVPKAQIQGLGFLLGALDTRLGSLIMTGGTTSFQELSLLDRSIIVNGWASARLPLLRTLRGVGELLAKVTWNGDSESLHAVLGFPKVPKHIVRNPSHDFKFLDFTDTETEQVVNVDADIVIVGSGCGAGVVAAHLSTSLKDLNPRPRILVLEKSYHWPSSHFPMDIRSAGVHLFEGGGGIEADDGSILILAGSTWGGGGTINWSASLQPLRVVREQWAQNGTVSYFTSQAYQDDLDSVCSSMGVCSSNDEEGKARIPHNEGNKILMEGARRLGLSVGVVPQNTAGEQHLCGRCSFGCAGTTKQGPANYWLPLAAKNGVEFIQGCWVEKVVWDETLPTSQPKRAIGLKATWTSQSRDVKRTLQINAPRIILSGGTLNTPLVLHRSSLTPSFNRHIGSNLHLHPALNTVATFPRRINPWDGPILTTAISSFDNMDGKGHGPKIEVMLGTPDVALGMMPQRPQLSIDATSSLPARATDAQKLEAATKAAADYRVRVARFGHSFGFVIIQRDHADAANASKSYVYSDPDRPDLIRVRYTPSEKDRAGLIEGALAASRVAYVMGANAVDVFSPGIPLFERPSANGDVTGFDSKDASDDERRKDDEAFEAWLKEARRVGPAAFRTTKVGSAHQMGTCRMAARQEDGAVRPDGRVWGTEGVWVADASALPSASGVNPMISNMGLSLGTAREIVKDVLRDARYKS